MPGMGVSVPSRGMDEPHRGRGSIDKRAAGYLHTARMYLAGTPVSVSGTPDRTGRRRFRRCRHRSHGVRRGIAAPDREVDLRIHIYTRRPTADICIQRRKIAVISPHCISHFALTPGPPRQHSPSPAKTCDAVPRPAPQRSPCWQHYHYH